MVKLVFAGGKHTRLNSQLPSRSGPDVPGIQSTGAVPGIKMGKIHGRSGKNPDEDLRTETSKGGDCLWSPKRERRERERRGNEINGRNCSEMGKKEGKKRKK